jgi:hypothetical protein
MRETQFREDVHDVSFLICRRRYGFDAAALAALHCPHGALGAGTSAHLAPRPNAGQFPLAGSAKHCFYSAMYVR